MSAPLPPVVRSVFDALDSSAIPYVVLRGYVPAGELSTSPDIDVFIPASYRRRAEAVIIAAGWHPRRWQTGRFPHRFFDRYDVPGRMSTTLDVVYDIVYGTSFHRLVHATSVTRNPERADGIAVPRPWIAAFIFALHVVLDKRTLSDANHTRAVALAALCVAPAGQRLLEEEWGPAAVEFTSAFLETVRSGNRELMPLTTMAAALPCLAPQPLNRIVDGCRVRLVRALAHPLRVAVVGLDGSGKSTLITRLSAVPSGLAFGSAYLGENNFLLRPFIAVTALLQRRKARYGPRSGVVRVLSKIRGLLLPLELYARMRRAEAWSAIVLYDRYPFPAYERMHPTTTPGALAMRIYERCWGWLLPQPDVLWWCDGDPETVWARKREYPFPEFVRGRERLKTLFDGFRGEKHVVRTDRPVEETIATAVALLQQALEARHR